LVKDINRNKGDLIKFILMSIIHRNKGRLLILIILIYIGETPVFWSRDSTNVVNCNYYDPQLEKIVKKPERRYIGIVRRKIYENNREVDRF
jgi:hypothetical protein